MSRTPVIYHLDTGGSWRGGQYQVFLLARELKKKGYEQIVLAPGDSPLKERILEEGIPYEEWSASGDLDLKSARKLSKIIPGGDNIVAHLHTARALGISSWSLRKKKNIKTLFTRRVDFPMKQNFLSRLKYSSPDKIVAISGFVADQISDYGLDEPEIIYSCVDTELFTPAEKREGNRIRIGMAGAIDLAHKDYITFVDAARILKDAGEELTFEIAGDGPDRSIIKKYIDDRGLSKEINLRGFIEKMPEFFSSLDILLHTVHYEALGTSILQGAASGLPVVASSAGGIPEIVDDGINGYLIPLRDPEAAADKLKMLISSPEKRESFAHAGRRKALEEFSPEAMADKYSKLYELLSK